MTGYILCLDCSLKYRGRAYGDLPHGRYLIIIKPDKSISLHNAASKDCVNWQNSGSEIEYTENKITATNKTETLTLYITKIIWAKTIQEWTTYKPKMKKTEEHLTEKIIENIEELIGEEIIRTEREYKTDYGPVDLAAFAKSGTLHIIEVKRGKASVNASSQLKKYMSAIKEENKKGWLMSPEVSKGALKHLADHGYSWVSVEHD